MSLFIASLNSGSNGNCYYIGSSHDAVLIDVGISCRETEKRMKALGLNIKNVRAIFVSHEHGDHIKGVSTLANKYSLPVYITGKTALQGPRLIRHLSRSFIANETVQTGDLTIIPFRKQHDAADPHSFVIEGKGIRIGVFTDIGEVCSEVIRYFGTCHAAFLEANYDEKMLEQGRYPIHLKNRIRGGHGHLSNRQALELFLQHRSPQLSHLLLSHLSKENNSPERAMELFAPHANGTEILVASRYSPSAVYEIRVQGDPVSSGLLVPSKPRQLGLFG
ncbi:MAG: MBL fold metallo-hydrolase [Chitinophagales bacterium]|nr:MBL fold metallo-hydrolase [Chitinophagales bacterium]